MSPRYRTVNTWTRRNGDQVEPPTEVEMPEGQAARLVRAKCLVRVSGQAEFARVVPEAETATLDQSPRVKVLGGGWYEVRGEKIQGRKAAEEAAER